MPKHITGVVAASATPVSENFTPDTTRLVKHLRYLLDNGCDGINLLGTTGEAASFSTLQRIEIMKAVRDAGLPMDRIMVGTGVSSLFETIELTKAANELGFNGALIVPPFYYTGIDSHGLLIYMDELMKSLGDFAIPIYLYHIPQNTGVAWPIEVVSKLASKYKSKVVGIKDSAGDMAYSKAVVKEIPGFQVFPSSEASLYESKSNGFAGCISATTNLTAADSQIAWSKQGTPRGAVAVQRATEHRNILAKEALVASVKAALSVLYQDPSWSRTMPPMTSRNEEQTIRLKDTLVNAGWSNEPITI